MAKRKPATTGKPGRSCEPMNDFGMMETIRALVDGSGMSRYEIAKLTGISQQVLSRAYNGTRCPKVVQVRDVAKAVGAKVTIRVEW